MLGARLVLAVLAASAIATTALSGDRFLPWGELTLDGRSFIIPYDIEVIAIGERPYDAGGGWVLRRTTTHVSIKNRKSVTVRWAESKTCPTLIPELAKLADLEPVSIQPPGRPYPKGRATSRVPADERDQIMYDAGTCQLSAPGHFAQSRWQGHVEINGSAGSPVCDWAYDAMKAWEPCWKSAQP